MKTLIGLSMFLGAGAAMAFAFPPYDIPWVVWVGLAPALLTAAHAPGRLAVTGGLLFGLVQAGLLLPWLFRMFGALAILLVLIYAVYFGLYFGILGKLCRRWGTHVLVWGAPILWVGVEFLRSEAWWLKFSWFGLGYSQHVNYPFLQAASVGGVYLLSFVIAAANGALAWALEKSARGRVIPLAAEVLAIAGLHWAGSAALEGERQGAGYSIAGVEGEGKDLEWFLERTEKVLDEHPETRLVVWPEWSIPERLPAGSATLIRIRELAKKRGVPILFGGTRAAEGGAADDFENTVFLVRPDGDVETQAKSEPVPFFADGRPAAGRKPLHAGSARIGVAVCYDMDFPYVSRDLARQEALAFVIPTMDALSWGGMQHRQHAAMAGLRAVEHRKWLVRVASSGISRAVDPYGHDHLDRGIGEGEPFVAEVGLDDRLTLYARYGYLLPSLCLMASVLITLAGLVRSRRRAEAGSAG